MGAGLNFDDEKLRRRFCKDAGIPINMFRGDYFIDRLNLYDKQYDALSKWSEFKAVLEIFENNDDYFKYSDSVIESAVNSIQSTTGYKRFNETGVHKEWVIPGDIRNIPKTDIFNGQNVGKYFISIDMKQANFTCLRYFDSTIVDDSPTYERFISKYTMLSITSKSKHIRQVVFGKCNPSRQVTYQRYLMYPIVSSLMKHVNSSDIVSYNNDEIVFVVSEDMIDKFYAVANDIAINYSELGIRLAVKVFRLDKVNGCQGYIERLYDYDNHKLSDKVDIKGVGALYMPYVLRALAGDDPEDSDSYFINEGMLSKLIDVPQVIISC